MQEELRLLDYASKLDYISPMAFASNYALLGDKEEAFEWVEKSYQERAAGLADIGMDPDYESLHSDVRFSNLLRRLKLP